MLTIGTRNYDLVPALSGFFVDLDPPRATIPRQEWRLVAHFVTSPNNEARLAEEEPEYWVLTITADDYELSDWRNLKHLGLTPLKEGETATWHGEGELSCRLGPQAGPHGREGSFRLVMGEMEAKRTDGYRFACELTACVRLEEDGPELGLFLKEELPFAGVSMNLPINANPSSAARARARREIGPLEVAKIHVEPPDLRRIEDPDAALEEVQRVHLRTPWRKSLA